MAQWKTLETDANLPLMAEVLHISEITAQVLANRGVRSKNTALAFLSPGLNQLHDSLRMKDAEKAFKRIADGIARGESIIVYGDYDVDGVMSTVILYKMLYGLGANVQYYIPGRTDEGYGLNTGAVHRLRENGVQLLITCDNGIAALQEVEEANALGIAVIVIDHHEPGFVENSDQRIDVIPNAAAVIDPKQAACPYPFKQLCAAGLAYKLSIAFYRYMNRLYDGHDEALVLAAVATICDIVDLQGENRVIVQNGLDVLNKNKWINFGLGCLIARKAYMDKTIDAFTIGFVIGPCINATGRLDSAALAVRLLLSTQKDDEGDTLAERLAELNEERKAMTSQGAKRLEAFLLEQETLDRVLVLVDKEIHESITGIVAGRIKESLHRPTIVITCGESGMKGSGRSVEAYNLFEALYKNQALFTRFGGHAMAAGLTLPEENIPLLRERLNAECTLSDGDFDAVLYIDRLLKPGEITMELANELARLAPFGKANREPLFRTDNLRVEALRIIDEKSTLIFTFNAGGSQRIKGIGFGLNDSFSEALKMTCDVRTFKRIHSGSLQDTVLNMDVVYTLETNFYNGYTSVQMRIRDFKIGDIG